MFGYDGIKELAKTYKARVTDFFALSPGRDPYYMVGNPHESEKGEWFADLYKQYWHTLADPMVRSLHYGILHHEVYLPDKQRTRYINLDTHYEHLLDASRIARYLGLVPMTIVEESKNEPDVFVPDSTPAPKLELDEGMIYPIDIYSFPDRPSYSLSKFPADQRYHLEIWCEKAFSSLKDLARKYGAVFQQGTGEQTLACAHMLAERRKRYNRPVRIFFISDFDPAGTTMPVSVSRKLEYMFEDIRGNDLDVRLYSLVLTQEQVDHYHLPRSPVKDTEHRKDVWEAIHGVDAVELNALGKGELVRIVENAILHYYDTSLGRRVYEARAKFEEELETIQMDIYKKFPELRRLRKEYDELEEEFAPRLQNLNDGIADTWERVADYLNIYMPDFKEYLRENPIPEPEVADEIDSPLYDSKRDYFNQLAVYKKHQGKRVVF